MRKVLEEKFVQRESLTGLIGGWFLLAVGMVIIIRGVMCASIDSSHSLLKGHFLCTFGLITVLLGVTLLSFSVLLRALYELKQSVESSSK